MKQLKRGMTRYKVSFVNGYLKAHPDIRFEPMSADNYTNTGSEEQWDEIHGKAAIPAEGYRPQALI